MNFDTIHERRGTRAIKWDGMEQFYGVSAQDGIAMWVADTDFQPPEAVQKALSDAVAHGIYGYANSYLGAFHEAVAQWMKTRHNWAVDPAHVFTTQGLGNAIGLCLQTYTKPGDGVVMFTPIYHTFERLIRANDRKVVECVMEQQDGRYVLDAAAFDSQMTGRERMMIFCSPHNPGGRVWSREELRGVADFCIRHDLILISDEIHHDLVFPGAKHIPMTEFTDITDRLIMLTAPSKTFNLAGLHAGNVIIPDDALRQPFAEATYNINLTPATLALVAGEAAYLHGAAWAEAQNAYLDENRRIFDAGIATIPGVHSMPLEATYLSWVDFSGTGMDISEIHKRVEGQARIAGEHGSRFGAGGDSFMRFNFGLPRARIEEAVARLQDAFSDLQ